MKSSATRAVAKAAGQSKFFFRPLKITLKTGEEKGMIFLLNARSKFQKKYVEDITSALQQTLLFSKLHMFPRMLLTFKVKV